MGLLVNVFECVCVSVYPRVLVCAESVNVCI